jgi:transposase InsO family protein
METQFCVEALEEALARYGVPDIFNTDQGSQFTTLEFISVLKDHRINISMDGKGRWMDNVFIERLWRSLKYECVYLQALENGSQARTHIGAWLSHDNRLIRPSMDKHLMRFLISLIFKGPPLKIRSTRHNTNQINCSLTSPQTCPRK